MTSPAANRYPHRSAMKISFLLKYLLLFLSFAPMASCEEENVVEPIHSLIYQVIEIDPPHYSDYLLYYDGQLGGDEEIRHGNFEANSSYAGVLELWGRGPNPNYSGERYHKQIAEEEAEEHQVFFEVSEGLNLTVTYHDEDENGMPVGLLTDISTGAPSVGQLTITVRHQPDKFAPNVQNGDITNAKGENDFSYTFDVVIE